MTEAVSLDLARAVDHVQHEYNTNDGDGNVLVIFKVGYHQRPGIEFQAAMERIQRALAGLENEVKMIGHWGGHVLVHPMREQLVNPVINEAMGTGFREAAAKAYPEMRVGMEGRTVVGDAVGYFVRMTPRP